MNSFTNLDRTLGNQPRELGVALARLDVGKGREELYRNQLPELLTQLAEQSRIHSITASSAIEGVVVSGERGEGIAVGRVQPPMFRNRNEREFAGYRDALDEIVRSDGNGTLTMAHILHLHRVLFSYTDAPGGTLKTEQNYIADETPGDGRQIVFEPPSPQLTPSLLDNLIWWYEKSAAESAGHPMLLISAFVLDFLSIHPFEDGNGRVARLLTAQLLLRAGYGVSRYVSIEQLIYENKNHYYDSLRESSDGWHDGTHSVWPWASFLVQTLVLAYDAFEERVAAARGPERMGKGQRVGEYVLNRAPATFSLADIRRALPGVSTPTIHLALRDLKKRKLVELVSVGRTAQYRRANHVGNV